MGSNEQRLPHGSRGHGRYVGALTCFSRTVETSVASLDTLCASGNRWSQSRQTVCHLVPRHLLIWAAFLLRFILARFLPLPLAQDILRSREATYTHLRSRRHQRYKRVSEPCVPPCSSPYSPEVKGKHEHGEPHGVEVTTRLYYRNVPGVENTC